MEDRIKRIDPEDLFLMNIKTLIFNFFINNINYKNGYYSGKTTYDVIRDVKDRAQCILDRIDQIDHLVKPWPEEDIKKQHEDLFGTVHHNACTSTIKNCLKEWRMVDKNGKLKQEWLHIIMPKHPPINFIKKG